MIDAKLKGEGIDVSEPEEPDRSNVVDLMAALKKSLAQAQKAAPKRPSQSPAPAKPKRVAAIQAAKPGRKRARLELPETGDRWRGGLAQSYPCHNRGIGRTTVRRALQTFVSIGDYRLREYARVWPLAAQVAPLLSR